MILSNTNCLFMEEASPSRKQINQCEVGHEQGFNYVRDWSLITGSGGGATKREGGGHVKFYPYEKRGAGKSLSHAGGGGVHQTFWGSFYVVSSLTF